jgi:hypothetical protein
MTQGVIAYVISLFSATSLNPLLADLSNLNLSIHLMIISILRPALLTAVMGAVIELTTFEVLPTDIIYDLITGVEPQGPTEAMEYCKYESNSYCRNVGSVFVFFWGILWIILIIAFLTKVSG